MRPAAQPAPTPGPRWAALAAAAAFLYGAGGPLSIVVAQIGIFGGLLLALSRPSLALAPLRRHPWLAGALIAYFLVQLVSVLYSVHPLRSLICLRGDWPVLFLPIFMVILQAARARRLGLATLLFALCVAGLYGLWQHATGLDPIRGRFLDEDGAGGFYATGTYRGHLTYAGVMLVGFLTAFFLLMAGRGRLRLYLGLVTLLAATGLLASYARTAWFGAAVGLLAGGATLLWEQRRRGRGSPLRRLAPVAAVLALLAIVLLASPALRERLLAAQESATLMPRIRLWGTAWAIFADHPIFGAGLGAFKTLFETYRLPGYYMGTGHPHSDILNVMVHSGAAGVIAWLGLWSAALTALWRRAPRRPEPSGDSALLQAVGTVRRPLGVGLVAAFLAAGLAQCYFTDEEPAAILWFVLALLLSEPSRAGSGPSAAPARRRSPGLGRSLEQALKMLLLPLAARLFLRRGSPARAGAAGDRRPARLSAAATILLVRQDSRLGNLVLMTPFLQALRAAAPAAHIAMLVGDRFADVLDGLPWVDELIVERKRWLIRHPWAYGAFLRRIRRRSWDVAFELSNPDTHSFYNAFLTVASGASLRVGFDHPRSRAVLNLPIPPPRRECHYSLAPLLLLGAFGLSPAAEPLRLSTPGAPASGEPSAVTPAPTSTNAPPGDLVIHIGGRGGKGWPLQRFAALLSSLSPAERERIHLIGGPGEAADLAALRRGQPQLRQSCLAEFAGLRRALAGAAVYLGCDAGPLHVAAALGVPTVSLFRSSHPLRYAPLGRPHLCLLLGEASRARVTESRRQTAPPDASQSRRLETRLCRHSPRCLAAPAGHDPAAEIAFVLQALRRVLHESQDAPVASIVAMCEDGRQEATAPSGIAQAPEDESP